MSPKSKPQSEETKIVDFVEPTVRDDTPLITSRELVDKTFIVHGFETFNSLKWGRTLARVSVTVDGREYVWLTGGAAVLNQLAKWTQYPFRAKLTYRKSSGGRRYLALAPPG